jgi:hypothetical protein
MISIIIGIYTEMNNMEIKKMVDRNNPMDICKELKTYKLTDKQRIKIEMLMRSQRYNLDDVNFFIDSLLDTRCRLIHKSAEACKLEDPTGFDLDALEEFYNV